MAGTENNASINTTNTSLVTDPDNYRSYIGSGTAVTDLSANGESVTLVGGTGYTSPGFTLDGLNDYINYDNVVSNIASDTVGYISIWIKPTTATSLAQVFMFSDTNASEYIQVLGLTGKIRVTCRPSGVNQWQLITDSAVLTDATWTHVALVQDGVSPVIYADGVAVSQTFNVSTDKTKWFTDCSGIDNGRAGCSNFNSGGNASFYTGALGEYVYLSTSPTAAEVLADYNATKDKYI